MGMEEKAPFPRASLFVASRLASVVQRFRHRLQEKVQQKKKSPNPFGVSYHRGIRLRALSDLERSAPPCRLTVTEEPRSAVEHHGHGRWISELLQDLNNHGNSTGLSLTQVAADDRLLLSHSQDDLIETIAQHASLPQAAYMFDSSTFLISRLEALQSDKVKKWAEADADCKRLKDESYIANLLHLLRRLQYLLFQVLVHRSITCLDEFASHWQTYWQQQKKLGQDWFTEWPSGRRPLSTTWPWNIRPSLVILWGVCWKFYPSEQKNEDHPRSPAQQLVDESRGWVPDFTDTEFEQARRVQEGLALDTRLFARPPTTQAHSHSSPTEQAAIVQNLNLTSGPPFSAGAQPQYVQVPVQGVLQAVPPASQAPWPRRQPNFSGISQSTYSEALPSTSLVPAYYTEQASPYSTSLESRDHSAWPTSTSGDFSNLYASTDQVPSNVWHGYNRQGPPIFYPSSPHVPIVQISPVEGESHAATLDPKLIQNRHYPSLQPSFGSTPEMGGIEGFPISPQSEGGRQGSIATPVSQPGSVVADHFETPSPDGNKGLQISMKRGDPPRYDDGRIYCAHPECAKDVPTFRRPCEWKKHMDKHERPYKCDEPGCDKVQGFTYSGGLLRHQREVHKKNNSPGRELYCQFPNCNRSNARPFTRQENRLEHVRRRHVTEGGITSPGGRSIVATPAALPTPVLPQDRSRKRKRTISTDFGDELQSRDGGSEEEEEDSERFKRLRGTLDQKDSEITQLRAELAAMRDRVAILERSGGVMKGHTLAQG